MSTSTRMLPLATPAETAASIAHAADLLRADGLVAFPTETVYGLGANALSERAVRRIYEAKRRDAADPCIVHIADLADLDRVAALPSGPLLDRVTALAAAFWPGPLSLILPRAAAVSALVTAGRPAVAVRMPAHPVALALLRAAGLPLAAPSANIFMHTSPTTAQHVWDDLAGAIDAILDGGPTPLGLESTVLDVTATPPRVLRPGGVSVARLRAVLGDVLEGPPAADDSPAAGLAAPGLLARHYAPRAEVILFDGPTALVQAELALRAAFLQAKGVTAGALLTDEDAVVLYSMRTSIHIALLGPADDLECIARSLYGAMRDLELLGVTVILARLVGSDGLGQAIDDRLRRAAGGTVIAITSTTHAQSTNQGGDS